MQNSCMSASGISASEVVVIANGFAVAFSKELSIDEQNIWGNLFALIGASLLSLAAINQTLKEQSSTAQSSNKNSSNTTKTDSSATADSKTNASSINITVSNTNSDTTESKTITTDTSTSETPAVNITVSNTFAAKSPNDDEKSEVKNEK
jgi:hypothetical protein